MYFIDFIKIEENVAREVLCNDTTKNVNFLTNCPVCQMVFGVVRCFQGLKQTYIVSETEPK